MGEDSAVADDVGRRGDRGLVVVVGVAGDDAAETWTKLMLVQARLLLS